MTHHLPDETWAARAADAVVDELQVAKLISQKDSDRAHRIVAQQLHMLLVGGLRPAELRHYRH